MNIPPIVPITTRSIRNILIAVVLTTPPVVLSQQALSQQHAYADDCDGDVAGQTVGLGCGENAPGGGDVDPDWEVIPGTEAGDCSYDPDTGDVPEPGTLNGNEVDSYFADIIELATGFIEHHACVAQAANATQNLAERIIPNPIPDSDYKAAFLTGAEITFTSTDMANYTVTVPGFPNASLTVTATDVTWDFGDGTTSNDLEPTHVYESIAPNASNQAQHAVHVTVTGTWKVLMLDNTTGTTTDLGSVSGTGAFDRSLVQVWSKQTEPNS